jgi:hypothetical protein
VATESEINAKIKELDTKYQQQFQKYRELQNISDPKQREAAAKNIIASLQSLLSQMSSLVAQANELATKTGSKVQLQQAQALTSSTGSLIGLTEDVRRNAQLQPATTTPTDNSNNPVVEPRPTNPPSGSGNPTPVSGDRAIRTDAQAQATQQDAENYALNGDWRVRLALAPYSGPILYRAPQNEVGILAPLQQTDGVIFPYTPSIQVSYSAKYEDISLIQSNYRLFQYSGSGIESVTISCDFTAQDTYEANYLLAVIHFFRTATKMFYGQDSSPKAGTPPPLCYLYGLGEFQFNGHPLAINSFNYNLPNNVNYIRASNTTTPPGVNRSSVRTKDWITVPQVRLKSGGINISPGGVFDPAVFPNSLSGTYTPTYVPTSINLQIQAYPIISRNQISNEYSTKAYATGQLLQGSRRAGGGFW